MLHSRRTVVRWFLWLQFLPQEHCTEVCDGGATYIEECFTEENELSFCECNLCQVYGTPTVAYGGSPPGGSSDSPYAGVTMSWMIPGVQSNHTLCRLHWAFIKVQTNLVDSDGVVNPQGVVVSIDTKYFGDKSRFSSVDILEVSHGNLPDEWASVHTETYPNDVFGLTQACEECPYEKDGVSLLLKQDSYTYSAGWDPNGDYCRGGQPEFLYFGVRCGNPDDPEAWSHQDVPCEFTVNVRLLPYELSAGSVVDKVPIPQGGQHFYSVVVGEYDVLRLTFARQGNNLTASCGADCVVSNGHGLIGELRFAVDYCPTAARHAETRALANTTVEVVREWFCTHAGEGGRYVLGLEAAQVFDPSGGAPGYEYPDGGKPYGAPEQLDLNPGGENNRLRPARGMYSLAVFHVTFEAGAIAEGENRSGCISYGQWRHFTLVSAGLEQASLVARVEARAEGGALLGYMPLSYLYVRRNKRPDAATYDARAHAPTAELSVSPCALDELRQWHLSVSMDAQLRANSEGLHAGYFVLTTQMGDGYGAAYGTADWPVEGGGARLIARPRAEGGTGHTCCGQTKLWLLRGVPAAVQLVVEVNVTRGRARALVLNRGTCPSPPAACVGMCSLTWLVAYDVHTRASSYLLEASVLSNMVPVTEPAIDDWVVGVQALDGGEQVEMSLRLSSLARTKAVTNYTCGRMAHFCPTEQKVENVTGYNPSAAVGLTSAAAGRRRAAPSWAAWAVVAVMATAATANPGACGRRRDGMAHVGDARPRRRPG